MLWSILATASVLLLIVYFHKGKNAVWGGLTLGIVASLITIVFSAFKQKSFNWPIVGKVIIFGVIIGFIAELLGKFSDLVKKKSLK